MIWLQVVRGIAETLWFHDELRCVIERFSEVPPVYDFPDL